MENFLITQGGCGTYALTDALGAFFNKGIWNTHNRDPNCPPKNSNVIYLMTNPYDAVLSYFRRDDGRGSFLRPHTCHLGGDINYFKDVSKCNIKNFIEDDYDPFKLEEHLNRWLYFSERNYNFAFFKYETLKDGKLLSFKRFWRVTTNNHTEFIFKKRNVNWENEDVNIRNGLKIKYESLFNFYINYPTEAYF